jgi:UDP-GlcNAc:undecaprenyl-phosphate GlcNAc-1-phosphate transferase
MKHFFEPVSYLAAFGVCFGMIWMLRSVAPHIGLVDHPANHRRHDVATPLVGGLAMFCGFLFAVLMLPVPLSNLRALFAGSALLIIIGVLDDLHELSSWARFVAQIAAALLMIYWGNMVLTDLGNLTEERLFTLGRFAVPLTVFATVGVINALNMTDGMDGLAGSLAAVALIFTALAASAAAEGTTLAVVLILLVTVVAFLLFNLRLLGRPRALVFMGDAGSMFLGFVLTWFFVSLSQGEQRTLLPVTALWFLALPLFDTVGMLLRRILLRRSPFLADREHMHHLLLALGLNVNRTLSVLVLVALVLAGIGYLGQVAGVPERFLFYGFILLFAVYFVGSWLAWNRLGGQSAVDAVSATTAESLDRRKGPADRRSNDRRSGTDRRTGLADRRARAGAASDAHD